MERGMKRRISTTPLKAALVIAVMAAAVFCLWRGAQKIGSGQQAESMKQLESSIRKATLTCYAVEGVYPPTIEYLEDNYGIQIDRSQFTVFYQVVGDNLMPDITVIERQ